jgi:hypothetical protein
MPPIEAPQTRAHLPLHLAATGQRREYTARFIRAGRIVRADGTPGPFIVPAEAITDALRRGLFAGLAAFVDHPEWFQNHSLRNLAGITVDPYWNDSTRSADGTIRLYPNAAGNIVTNLFDAILQDAQAGEPIPNVGLSLVFWPNWKPRDNDDDPRELAHFRHIQSVDFVFTPAADGRIKEAMAALSALGQEADRERDRFAQVLADAYPQLGSDIARAGEDLDPNLGPPADVDDRRHDPNPITHERSTQMPPTEEPTPDRELWLEAMRGATARTVIDASGLPQSVRDFLLTQDYQTPDQLNAAIDAQRAIIADLQADDVVQVGGTPPRASGISMGPNSIEQLEIALEALLKGVTPPSGVAALSGIRELYHLLSGDYEMYGVYHPDRIYLAAVTSATMSNLTANVLNKIVINEFQQYDRWWEPIVSIEDFASLQTVRWITLGGVGELPTVSEGAAYTEMTWDDKYETSAFVKKGGYLGITLEAIDKDDVRRLARAPRAIAQAAWLTLGKAVSAIFTDNAGVGPTLSDAVALFDAGHSNLGTTALSWSQWIAVRTAMMKQTELNSGERLGFLTSPRYILVPIDLEMTAIQILASEGEPGTADNDTNPLAEGDAHDARMRNARSRVIVVPFWTDTNNWAAAADPRLYPSIGLGFRFGRTPEIFSVASPTAGLMFTNDTMPVKVRFFFAVGPTDYRGLYKENV